MSEIKIQAESIKLQHNYPLRALFIADLHCGEQFAWQPEEFKTYDGRIFKPSPVQKYILKQWQSIKQVADEFKVQYVFVLGDLLGGLNPKDEGKYITCDIRDQVRMATQGLAEIAKDRITYIVSGTKYHSIPRGEGEPEEDVAIRLRDMGFKAHFLGDMAYVEVNGMKRKRRIFIAHESATGLVYPATLMSRDVNWTLQSYAQGKTPRVDAIVRAHLHHWLYIDQSRIHCVQLPGFMALTPYQQTIKYYFKLQPDIGGALMLADEEGRLRFWHFLMPQEDYLKMSDSIVKTEVVSLQDYRNNFPEIKLEGE